MGVAKKQRAEISALIRDITATGIRAVYLEHVLGLPVGFTRKPKLWDTATVALLRTIKACPWMLGVAQDGFRDGPAKLALAEAALEMFDPVPAGEMPLDPGIRRHVLLLRSSGIETYQSCQGGQGHPLPEPTVLFHGNAYEGFRAYSVAMTFGLPVLSVRHVYAVIGNVLHGPHWEMTFRADASPPAEPEVGSG